LRKILVLDAHQLRKVLSLTSTSHVTVSQKPGIHHWPKTDKN